VAEQREFQFDDSNSDDHPPRKWGDISVAEFMEGIPLGDSDCPVCGGAGWIGCEVEGYERCYECMPPSLVFDEHGLRQGDRELDCEFIGRWRRRRVDPNEGSFF
jgi:hypothetical protein